MTCGLSPVPEFIPSEQSVVIDRHGAFVLNNIGKGRACATLWSGSWRWASSLLGQRRLVDEGTSHLDAAREAEVNEAIRTLNITRVVVAHRRETIAAASRVVHMIDGKFVDMDGSPSSTGDEFRAMEPPG